jgi:hypothetical protein
MGKFSDSGDQSDRYRYIIWGRKDGIIEPVTGPLFADTLDGAARKTLLAIQENPWVHDAVVIDRAAAGVRPIQMRTNKGTK